MPFIVTESEWSIVFEPLAVPSDKDQAEVLNKNVDSIVKLIQDQAMDTEEARDTLRSFGSILKLKETDKIKLPEPEPEPGMGENDR